MSRAERRREAAEKSEEHKRQELAAWHRMDKRSQHRALMLIAERYVQLAERMSVDRVLIGTNQGAKVLDLRAVTHDEAERFFASQFAENPSHMVRPGGEDFSDMLQQPEKKHAD